LQHRYQRVENGTWCGNTVSGKNKNEI